tara:strand:+ start:2187 stop:2324 length:138 start_codon:yes stop_codon:yes gene_type:complete
MNKKEWVQMWRWEINAQKHRAYLINKRGKISKEFKKFVKDFYKRK